MEILDKMNFFQGQRAGRELWNDKPFEVQEEDLGNFKRDIDTIGSYIWEIVKELKQYRDAEEQGLLLRLPAPLDDVESFEIADKGIWMKIPCRQGDTVYEIDGITWKGHDWKYRSYESAFVKETVFRFEMLSEIGKTVFLTKEEAEQALAKMKEV